MLFHETITLSHYSEPCFISLDGSSELPYKRDETNIKIHTRDEGAHRNIVTCKWKASVATCATCATCGPDTPTMCGWNDHSAQVTQRLPRRSSRAPGCAALPKSIHHLWQTPAAVRVTLPVIVDPSLHLVAATRSKLYVASLDRPTSFVTTMGRKKHSVFNPFNVFFLHFSSFTWNTCSSRWSARVSHSNTQ